MSQAPRLADLDEFEHGAPRLNRKLAVVDRDAQARSRIIGSAALPGLRSAGRPRRAAFFERRVTFMNLIGDLNLAWSNNESLFIYALMLLLRTDERAAAIVFATLNTTRARLDLVQRLAKIAVADRAVRNELTEIVEKFSATTRLRNDFSHATFVIDEHGEITHTQHMKVEESRGNLCFRRAPPGGRRPAGRDRPRHPRSRHTQPPDLGSHACSGGSDGGDGEAGLSLGVSQRHPLALMSQNRYQRNDGCPEMIQSASKANTSLDLKSTYLTLGQSTRNLVLPAAPAPLRCSCRWKGRPIGRRPRGMKLTARLRHSAGSAAQFRDQRTGRSGAGE